MSQTKVTLNYTKLGGYYTLSSSNTNVVQITNNGQSFIYKGKTYTPTLEKSSGEHFGWRLNSFTMPSGSVVGTSSPSSSTKVSPNTMSDYSSSSYNYYTHHSSSSSKSLSISINTSSGVVSGDTSYCTYTTEQFGGVTPKDYGVSVSIDSTSGVVSGDTSFCDYDIGDDSTTISGESLIKGISIDKTSGIVSGDKTWCSYDTDDRGTHDTINKSIYIDPDSGELSGDLDWCNPSVSQKSVPYSETGDYQIYINSSSGYVSGAVGLCTYTKENKGVTTKSYYISKATWDATIVASMYGGTYICENTSGVDSEDDTYYYNTATYYASGVSSLTRTYTVKVHKQTGSTTTSAYCSFSTSYTSTTSPYWEFTQVTWGDGITLGDYTYKLNSVSAFDKTIANYTRTRYVSTWVLDSANWVSSKDGYTLSGSSSASSTTYTSDEITTHDYYFTSVSWNSSGVEGGTTYYFKDITLSSDYDSNAQYKSRDITIHNYYFKSFSWKSGVTYGGTYYTYDYSIKNETYFKSANYTYNVDTRVYYLTSCTWDSYYSYYRYSSGNFSNGKQTSCTGRYTYSSSWYSPDVYVSFKWDSTNNTFTWTTSGDSSVISNIQSNFTYSVDELYNQELIKTNWNFDPKLSYKFTTKDDEIKTKNALVSSTNYELIVNDDVIKFKDKFGKVTSINSISEIKKLVS